MLEQLRQKPVEKITRQDISKNMPGVGETGIIMQRHEKYIRDTEHERSGSLETEDAQKALDQTVEILGDMLAPLSEEDRRNVTILVIASNTNYGKAKGMRSFETATEVANGVQTILGKYGLDEKQLLNSGTAVSQKNEGVLPSKNKGIQEPRMFEESPEFVAYLREKYEGQTQKFWQAFEEDWEKETRERMGAEGPPELLQRYSKFIEILNNFSAHYHKKNPGKRLLIWTVSHYDTISPYAKNKVFESDPNEHLPVNYGAGFTVRINKEGEMMSDIGGQEYKIKK
jgi:hypothetical protein